ncbi:CerR family C-terminal domain-containing protein [Curvibacter sp. CHRR-16]|uniref:CerR family C-terminal domain-containing protein n=1 Tax=Curvibacter sp. CHRR-16 TaxID=2835872 RepID=UPI001BDA0E14|nr:CerR family C-terminal domain-containing protein [Curvibacter sp. CHRR-16]MBT0571087.1 CerR family C-terminal domain-containing protein [Curvibacter sp. CHRR-16]
MSTDQPHTAAPVTEALGARNRLLDAALLLFAEKGFAKTSIRDIAQAAHTNVASISYYFGDKVGLYRAVFADPRTNPPVPLEVLDTADMDLAQGLRSLLESFVMPLKQGQGIQQCYMKLCFREMLEPTGVWQHELETSIVPAHMAMARMLCRHLQLHDADVAVHRLVFAINSLGVMLHVGNDLYTRICPSLVDTPQALDAYLDSLVTYALALVDAEARRRTAAVQAVVTSTPLAP